MSRAKIDLTGKRFGRLVVIEECSRVKSGGSSTWKCLCDCGKYTTPASSDLRRGRTISCGCYNKEITREACTKHGLSNHPLFDVWYGVKKRCSDPKHPAYHNYGGRGITVCDKWLDFQNFYNDMVEGYKKGLQIDRINTNGNYSPENCRWVTRRENNRNKRNNRLLEYKGETKTLSEWSEILGIRWTTLKHRLLLGWDIDRVFETPVCTIKRESNNTY